MIYRMSHLCYRLWTDLSADKVASGVLIGFGIAVLAGHTYWTIRTTARTSDHTRRTP